MSDRIAIRGIEAFGHHGVFDHETRIGQRFVVDVALDLDLSAAAASDQLRDTVDYGHLAARVVEVVTGEPVALIERLAARIADECLVDTRVTSATVTVHKPAAPLPVAAADVEVTVTRSRP
ncbi:MAG: dihydroneopterin aldolase [Nitriliruptoraceae bacterium]